MAVKEALNGYAHEINVREMSKADRNSTLLMSETRGILDTQYDRLLPFLRSRLPNDVLKWFDTVIVLQGGEKRAATLLISGGNDGNFDFSVTFMDFLQQAFSTSEKSTGWLRASLFSAAVPHALSGTAGHLYPGSYDGPNSSVGFSGGGGVNPWDFVLMIEGVVLLAGAVSRRQGAGDLPTGQYFPSQLRRRRSATARLLTWMKRPMGLVPRFGFRSGTNPPHGCRDCPPFCGGAIADRPETGPNWYRIRPGAGRTWRVPRYHGVHPLRLSQTVRENVPRRTVGTFCSHSSPKNRFAR